MKKIILQKYTLVLVDLFSLVFTYWLSVQLANVVETTRLHRFDTDHLVLVQVLNAFAIIALFWVAELYAKRRPTWEELRIVYKQIMYILVLDFVVISLSRSEHVIYLFFFMFWALLLVILPLFRTFAIRILLHYKLWQRKVYIVGCGTTALMAYNLLKNRRLMGYQIEAFINLDETKPLTELVVEDSKIIPVFSFEQLLLRSKYSEIVVALDSLEMVNNMQKIFSLQRQFIFVSLVPDLEGLSLYGMEITHFFGNEQLM